MTAWAACFLVAVLVQLYQPAVFPYDRKRGVRQDIVIKEVSKRVATVVQAAADVKVKVSTLFWKSFVYPSYRLDGGL